jgi:hypothetical protein
MCNLRDAKAQQVAALLNAMLFEALRSQQRQITILQDRLDLLENKLTGEHMTSKKVLDAGSI